MTSNITSIELQQLLNSTADFMLLDVREPHEYAFCNLGGYSIPLGELEARLCELDKNKLIVVHCRSGYRSQQAINILEQAGFTNLQHYAGGILGWARDIDADFPVY